MSATDVDRWQFALTTLYHFIFVPVTLGMSWSWPSTPPTSVPKDPLEAPDQFWGRLFLINVAMGVVTGIVQEFQFGMNWSAYSRYVGDIFGAPLAMEALIAFFLESTFLGVWIFGWGRLTPKVHLATIYLTAGGTWLSAAFILCANSWMQHPVGYQLVASTDRRRPTSTVGLLTNPVFFAPFHTSSLAASDGGRAAWSGVWLASRATRGRDLRPRAQHRAGAQHCRRCAGLLTVTFRLRS